MSSTGDDDAKAIASSDVAAAHLEDLDPAVGRARATLSRVRQVEQRWLRALTGILVLLLSFGGFILWRFESVTGRVSKLEDALVEVALAGRLEVCEDRVEAIYLLAVIDYFRFPADRARLELERSGDALRAAERVCRMELERRDVNR